MCNYEDPVENRLPGICRQIPQTQCNQHLCRLLVQPELLLLVLVGRLASLEWRCSCKLLVLLAGMA
jgi:hypothetical protein